MEYTLFMITNNDMSVFCEPQCEEVFLNETEELRENDDMEVNQCWTGDGSGEDDLADYNANEVDDYRDE